jgi:glycosyltransferase involved in cell wall biosynthesis
VDSEVSISIVIPAYNPGKKITYCLNALGKNLNFFSKKSKLTYEVLIINDAGEEINLKFNHGIKNINIFRIRKNKGVGYVRQLGTRISKYNYIFYLDSDVVLENEDTIKILFEEFKNFKSAGSVGPVQSYKNLNHEFTSDFVAAKNCYGFEGVENEVEFSGMRSECCFMKKSFLKSIGGWKYFPRAGGEEFELGHRILKSGKKNYVTKKTNYTTFYDNLYSRCKTVVFRTSSYLIILIKRKKFESKGAFATLQQALSTFLTSLTIFFMLLLVFVNSIKIIYFIVILIFLNFFVEFNFIKFAVKHYKKINILIYPFGIYAINFSIMLGTLLGVFRLFSSKKLKIYHNKKAN